MAHRRASVTSACLLASGVILAHMHPARGKLLFRLTADKQPERFMWGSIAAVLAILYVLAALREHRNDWWMVIYFAGYGVSFLLARKVAFYENGIYFPQDPSGGRSRFIPWTQVERFYWDGDVLTIMPDTSVLGGGGGGSIGLPLLGGSVHVPPSRRVEAENLLSAARNAKI